MKSRTVGSIIVIALAAIGAFALIAFPSLSVEAVYPAERAKGAVARGLWPRVVGMFRGSAVAAENRRLKRENGALSLLKGDVDRLQAENARLRRALGYVSRKAESWVAAGVLSRGGGAVGVHDVIRVDRGARAGIAVGAVVVAPEGLVGRVTSVTPHTSEVTLVTDPSVKVACEISPNAASRAFGILSGGGDDLLVLRHLRHAGSLSPRARVLTSGRGGVFPAGLEVGTLLEVRKDPGGLSCEGEVLPSVDYSTLEDVFIRCEK